jgi:hypothetical protein
MSKTFSVADVASHKDASSGLYIIVDDSVYDVTSMLIFPLPSSLVSFPILSHRHLTTPPVLPLRGRPLSSSFLSIMALQNSNLQRLWTQRLKCRNRLRRRAPRRSQDPQASRRQGRYQAILEIPQRECIEEVRAEAEDWDGG